MQTMYPDDPTIDLAAHQDYVRFYQREITDREELGFPPFARLILVTVR